MLIKLLSAILVRKVSTIICLVFWQQIMSYCPHFTFVNCSESPFREAACVALSHRRDAFKRRLSLRLPGQQNTFLKSQQNTFLESRQQLDQDKRVTSVSEQDQ